jgi:hypothetical protein
MNPRHVITIALISLGITSAAHAADVFGNRYTGNWSDPAAWQAGVPPGPTDMGFIPGFSTILFDVAAVNPGGVGLQGSTFTLAQSLSVGELSVRESTVDDGGFDIDADLLTNGTGSGNGGTLIRRGGTLTVGRVVLARVTADWQFAPGDSISDDVVTQRLFSVWPDFSVHQDNAAYADTEMGLSLDNPSAPFVLGRTSAADQSQMSLFWDASVSTGLDWTFRWAGDHVSQLRAYYNNGQIVIGSTPGGAAFSATDNIFYDAATDYTYVAYAPDSDGDGIRDPQDLCEGNDQAGDGDADGVCNDLDFNLLVTSVSPGAPVTFLVSHAPPSTSVQIWFSTAGLGDQPCLPTGACGHLDAARSIATLTTNAQGHGTFTMTVPATVPVGRIVGFQAAWAAPGSGDLTPVEIRRVE